jgi:hypothetical protein
MKKPLIVRSLNYILTTLQFIGKGADSPCQQKQRNSNLFGPCQRRRLLETIHETVIKYYR